MLITRMFPRYLAGVEVAGRAWPGLLGAVIFGYRPRGPHALRAGSSASCGTSPWELVFRAMGVIDVRRFHAATYWDSGELGVADVSLVDEDIWDIDLAEVVKVNALAVPADRKLTYRVMQHELRLLLSFLVDTQGRPLTLRHGDFRASSGHVKRFISESLAGGCSPQPLSDTIGGS